MTKDPTFRGSHYAHIYETNDYKGGATPIARRIQQIKTRNYANSQVIERILRNRTHTGKLDNKKIVYETIEDTSSNLCRNYVRHQQSEQSIYNR